MLAKEDLTVDRHRRDPALEHVSDPARPGAESFSLCPLPGEESQRWEYASCKCPRTSSPANYVTDG